jgi:hypothetical protein
MTIHSSYKLKNAAKSSSSPKYATITIPSQVFQEGTVKTITGQHPFMKRSEAMQVYESHRRTLAAQGYKHAFSPDAFSIGYTYEEIKAE